jgi:hypothetical protein
MLHLRRLQRAAITPRRLRLTAIVSLGVLIGAAGGIGDHVSVARSPKGTRVSARDGHHQWPYARVTP